jgi:hypothetical protein
MNEPFHFEQLQKKIKKQRYKRGVYFLLATIVVTTAVILALPKFVSFFYYDPRQSSLQVNRDSYIMNRQINNELTTQNHFLSNYDIRSLGFGKYEVSEVYQNRDQNQSTVQTVTIDKNHLLRNPLSSRQETDVLFELRMRNSSSKEFSENQSAQQNLLANLKKLPKSTSLITTIIFEKDVSLEELKEWQQYQMSEGEVLWTAVRTGVPTGDQDFQPIGFANSFSSVIPEEKSVDESFLKDFPFLDPFEATDKQQRDYSETEQSAAHFESMLNYLLTQKDFLALEANDARDILSEEQIEEALAYIQKNGIRSYGISAVMTVDALIKLLEEGENILTARVMETNVFPLMSQTVQK